MQITETLIESAYRIARHYYDAAGSIRITDAKNELAALGMNPNSSTDMIYNFKHLMNGNRYTRKLSVIATREYLIGIRRDYGDRRLRNAVSALRQHIEYYQTLKDTPMTGHAAILAEYERILSIRSDSFISPEEFSNSDPLKEGRSKSVLVNVYERNPNAREACIDFYGTACKVCNFDFESRYGAVGRGFIHVHHLVDLASIGKEYVVDPIKDLRPVCPNCHAMLHKSKPAYPIAELQDLMKKQKK